MFSRMPSSTSFEIDRLVLVTNRTGPRQLMDCYFRSGLATPTHKSYSLPQGRRKDLHGHISPAHNFYHTHSIFSAC